MVGEKGTLPVRPEVIALPPLKMALTHTKDDQVSKKALAAAIRKLLPPQERVGPKAIMKIIEFLEQKSKEK